MLTLILAIGCFLLACAGLFFYWELRSLRVHLGSLAQVYDSLPKRQESRTAQEIADKRKPPFRLRKSWAEERAELEAANATKDQKHERLVEEIEKSVS